MHTKVSYEIDEGLYMGINTSIQQFVERLNGINRYLLSIPEENSKQLDQDEIIEILDQANAGYPEWHEAIVNANIDIFEMSYEESMSYFKRLENLEKISHTNGPNPSLLPVDNKKRVSVTISVGKSSKNHKGSNIWCHYCDKINHNTADCRAIAKFKQQKRITLKPNLDSERSLWPSFPKKLMHSKGSCSLKRLQAVRKERLNPSSFLSTEINLSASSDECEEYLFPSSKHYSSSKNKLEKSSHPTINH
jgi:hypothetical protein